MQRRSLQVPQLQHGWLVFLSAHVREHGRTQLTTAPANERPQSRKAGLESLPPGGGRGSGLGSAVGGS